MLKTCNDCSLSKEVEVIEATQECSSNARPLLEEKDISSNTDGFVHLQVVNITINSLFQLFSIFSLFQISLLYKKK